MTREHETDEPESTVESTDILEGGEDEGPDTFEGGEDRGPDTFGGEEH